MRKPAARQPAVRQPVPPAPKPGAPPASPPTPVLEGGLRQAERLLWRAGFGPSPGHAEALAAMGLQAAVASLTRPAGAATLTGAPPSVDGAPLEVNAALGPWTIDFLWRDQRLAVETDGARSHDRARQRESDSTRNAWLAARGYLPLGFTWQQVTDRPH